MEIKKISKKNFEDCGSVVVSGNCVEYTLSSLVGKPVKWKKLKEGLYVNIDTGEIIEREHSNNIKNKQSNIKSVRQSIKRIRRVINANFFAEDNEYFITLTYKENMQDPKKLYSDFNKFIKRLKYKLNDNDLKYINVIEPQGRGAWHCHVLIKAHSNWLVEKLSISDIWGHGFVYCSKLEGLTDNVGAYLSAYLTNTKDKKGARLYLYPQHIKIFRCSRNCNKPKIYKMFDYQFKEHFKNLKLKYNDSFEILHKGQVLNRVYYRSYEVV